MQKIPEISKFLKYDARTERTFIPTVEEYLIEKYNILLPHEFVQGKTVLDLGSHIGTCGEWVLSQGAKFYIGVETQSKFYKLSKELLKKWNNQTIINQNIKHFLKHSDDYRYDIIILFGVLYAFSDCTEMLRKIFNIGNFVLIESATPPSIYTKEIPEKCIIEYSSEHRCNTNVSDKGNYQYQGFSGVPSQSFVDMVANISGFTKISSPIKGTDINSKLIYNKEITARWVSKYRKMHNEKMTLEDQILNKTDTETKIF